MRIQSVFSSQHPTYPCCNVGVVVVVAVKTETATQRADPFNSAQFWRLPKQEPGAPYELHILKGRWVNFEVKVVFLHRVYKFIRKK